MQNMSKGNEVEEQKEIKVNEIPDKNRGDQKNTENMENINIIQI